MCAVPSEVPFLAVDLTSVPGSPSGSGVVSTPVNSSRRTDRTRVRWQFPVGDIRARAAADWGTVFLTAADGILHAIDVADGIERWRVTIGSGATAPVLYDDIVLATGGNRLYAFDADDGSEVWSAVTGPSNRFSPAAIHDGVVYVGNRDRFVYAVSPIDGDVFWCTRTGGPVETRPAVTNDLVYARSTTGELHALETATGEERWRHPTGWAPGASVTVISAGIVVTSGPGDPLTCLDADTGSILWQTQLDGEVTSPPVGCGGIVFVPIVDSTRRTSAITAIEASTGYARWRVELDTSMTGSPSLSDTAVHVGGVDGTVHSFDRQTGREIWTYARPDTFAASSPIVVDGVLYVGGVSTDATSTFSSDDCTSQ